MIESGDVGSGGASIDLANPIEIDSLRNLRVLNNWVLIKPNRGQNEIVLNNGMKLYLDISFEPEKHAPIVGTVIKAPERLVYNRDNEFSMQWKTEMELKEGDTVYYHYLSALNALRVNDPKVYLYEGEIYILVRYDKCFCAKRDGDIVMLNGFVLIEPVEDDSIKTFLEIPSIAKKSHSTKFGRVKYCGSCNQGYLRADYGPDPDQIEPGDLVALARVTDIPLEYDLHASLEGKNKFFRVQRHLILAIMKK